MKCTEWLCDPKTRGARWPFGCLDDLIKQIESPSFSISFGFSSDILPGQPPFPNLKVDEYISLLFRPFTGLSQIQISSRHLCRISTFLLDLGGVIRKVYLFGFAISQIGFCNLSSHGWTSPKIGPKRCASCEYLTNWRPKVFKVWSFHSMFQALF